MQRHEDYGLTGEDEQQQQQQQQLQRLTASSVADLMREQDADLLESHHALGVNKDDDDDHHHHDDNNNNNNHQRDISALIHTVASTNNDVNVMHAVIQQPLTTTPPHKSTSYTTYTKIQGNLSLSDNNLHHTRRPTLSGEVFPHEPQDIAGVTDASDNSCKQEEDFDRQISEAAQFAAAVGEASNNIPLIQDSDDDDSAEEEEETNHEVRSVNSALALSVGDASFHSMASAKHDRTAPSQSTPLTVIGRPLKATKAIATKRGFLDQLPGNKEGDQPSYIYKGIRANPPEIVRRGIQRGNYAQLHRKAWLEVSDKYHRYGKNLRLYYRHWEKLGCPYRMFFDWLDSKGEAAGQPLPELEECPRAQLDSDIVLYITNPDITEQYAVNIVVHTGTGRGLMVDAEGKPIVTGPDGWIFVLRDNRFYGAMKITSALGERSKQRFHHSSFFGGKAVEAAGIFITDNEGYLSQLLPHSGHYRPGEAHMQRVLFFLYHMGVDLRTFDMDMQQILHVARDEKSEDGKVEKKKKLDSLCLQPAVLAACFLAHKARFISTMQKIHKIQKGASSVTEALGLIDAAARSNDHEPECNASEFG